MNAKKKALISSFLTLCMCLSLIAGATYAIFTDEAKVNIAVTSGKIDLEAQINTETLKAYSRKWNYTTEQYDEYGTVAENGKALFRAAEDLPTGGTVTATEATVTLNKMAPLDRVTFDIEVVNKSDIDVAYRIRVIHEGELYDALDIAMLKHGDAADGYFYATDASEWITLEHGNNGVVNTFPVEIVFPDAGKHDNAFQGKSCELSFIVEACQAYAKLDVAEEEARTWFVSNEAGFSTVANGLYKSGDTINVLSDLHFEKVGFKLENVNLDLHGHKMTFNRELASDPKSFDLFGDVIISNGSLEAALPTDKGVIYANSESNVTLNDVNIKAYNIDDTRKVEYGAAVFGGYMVSPNGNMTINGGVFDSKLTTNGSTRGGSITVNDGIFNEETYLPAYMKYTINGGTFKKNIKFVSGEITITGGTFMSEDPITLAGQNGTIEGEGYGLNPVMTISGGTFSCDVSDYCADGFYSNEVSTGVWEVSTHKLVSIDSTKAPAEQQKELTNVISGAKVGATVDIVLPAGTFDVKGGVSGTTLNVTGQLDEDGNPTTVINNANASGYKTLAADAVFENVTITGRSGDANPDGSTACGWGHNKNTTYRNCTFIGSNTFFCYEGYTQTFENCHFISDNSYPFWTSGSGTFVLTDCDFDVNGKAIKVASNSQQVNIEVTGCTFKTSADKKAAIELDTQGNSTATVTLVQSGNTAEGFASRGLWAVREVTQTGTVTVNGHTVTTNDTAIAYPNY